MATKIAFLIIITLFTVNCEKQDPADKVLNEMSAQKGYKNWYLETFRCGVFVPPSYTLQKKYPLILFLHGHSDTTTWNMRWYNEPFITNDPCIVLTPKCPIEQTDGWGNSWDPRVSPMMQKTFQMINLVKQALNVDTSRIYIHGTSMGGIGTYGVIQKNTTLFTAGYSECGSGNAEIAPILAKIPFWIFHGSNDYIVSPQGDRNIYKAVIDNGGKQIRYTEYPGVGHNVWDYTKNENALPYWLLAQRNGAVHGSPDAVTNFKETIVNSRKIKLEWEKPTDTTKTDNQIWYYKIYRNEEVIKEADNSITSIYDTTVLANKSYQYKISVVNFFFKESKQSPGINLITGSK